MQFGFRHRAFEPEHESVIEEAWVIDPIGVADERVGDAAQIEQSIPIGIVARESRDFQAQHESHVAQRDLRRQVGEAGTVREPRSGYAEVLIDDGDVVACPAQVHGTIDKLVLPVGGLAVVLDLRGRRLPDVHERRASHVVRGDLEALTHGPSPGQRRLASDTRRRASRSVALSSRRRPPDARRPACPTRGRRSRVLAGSRGLPVVAVALSRPFCIERPSSIEAPSRRRRASTMVRMWSNSAREASVATRS
jgi:hypothetical protein